MSVPARVVPAVARVAAGLQLPGLAVEQRAHPPPQAAREPPLQAAPELPLQAARELPLWAALAWLVPQASRRAGVSRFQWVGAGRAGEPWTCGAT